MIDSLLRTQSLFYIGLCRKTLKAHYPMSYADCFEAALAIQDKAVLLASDPEFNVLGNTVTTMKI